MPAPFDDEQPDLSQLWKKARKGGCMSLRQQAKAHGTKEAWEEPRGDRMHGQLQWTADRADVQGPERQRPNANSSSRLVSKMVEDENNFQAERTGARAVARQR